MDEIAKFFTPEAFITALALIIMLILFVPLALRIAGLTGEQIMLVLSETTRFFLALVNEFRSKLPPDEK